MEEGRRLAETVPGSLLLIAYEATTAGGLLDIVASIHANLSAYTKEIATLRAGGAAVIGSADGSLGRNFPSALRELSRLGALHTNAGRAFVLSGASLGFRDGAEGLMWRKWQGQRADVRRHAEAALRRLDAAASQTGACVAAIRSAARSLPSGSPGWHAGLSEAVRLGTNAVVTTAMAFHAVRRMRDAVSREFFEAWMVLNWD